MKLIGLASLALCLTTSALLAQQSGAAPAAPAAATPQPSINPEAQKLLEAHKAVNKTIKDMTYDVAAQFGEAGDEALPSEEMGGRAHLSFLIKHDAEGLPFDSFHVQLKDKDGKTTEEWAGTPTQLQRFDFEAKKLLTMENSGPGGNVPPMSAFQFFPQWIFESAGMGPETQLKGAELLADATIGGVACRVLKTIEETELPAIDELEDDGAEKDDKAVAPRMIVTTTRWIGTDDKVLRKLHAEYKVEGLPEATDQTSTFSAEYTNVSFNKGLTGESLALKLPEGFTAEAADPDKMGITAGPDMGEAPELKVAPGDDAPAFTLKDTNGAEVSLAGLKGRVVLLDFWATWCGPCKAAMPGIQKLHEQFKDKPVSIIGVNTREESDTAAAAYMKKKNYTYTCLLKGDELAGAYGISGIPTFVLIDANGKVLDITVGFDPESEARLAKQIEDQLSKK